jgi:hypothetical protein
VRKLLQKTTALIKWLVTFALAMILLLDVIGRFAFVHTTISPTRGFSCLADSHRGVMALSCSKDLQTFYPPVPYFEFAISRIAPWEHIVDFALVDIEVTPWEKPIPDDVGGLTCLRGKIRYGGLFACLGIAALWWFAVQRTFIRSVRRKRARCLSCGYDISRSRERCPECNEPISGN